MTKKKREDEISGKWGIFTQDRSLPTIRYDPFSTFLDSKGNKIGQKTIISPSRYFRPIETELDKTEEGKQVDTQEVDTFCELISGKRPAIVISRDLEMVKTPFATEALSQNLEESKAVTIINLYAPIARVLLFEMPESNPRMDTPTGLSYVHILTKHYKYPEEVPIDEWNVYFKNYSKTMASTLSHPNFSDSESVIINSFFNIGNLAGASIPHLHGQSYIYEKKMELGSRLYSYWKSSVQSSKSCKKCDSLITDKSVGRDNQRALESRIIYENDEWISFLAYAPEKDGHIRLVPKRHVSAFWKLDDNETYLLSKAFVISNQILAEFIREEGKTLQLDLDRNIVLRQFHTLEDSHFHAFIDILPVQKLGGAELSDSQKISSLYPELIASKMRQYIEIV